MLSSDRFHSRPIVQFPYRPHLFCTMLWYYSYHTVEPGVKKIKKCKPFGVLTSEQCLTTLSHFLSFNIQTAIESKSEKSTFNYIPAILLSKVAFNAFASFFSSSVGGICCIALILEASIPINGSESCELRTPFVYIRA